MMNNIHFESPWFLVLMPILLGFALWKYWNGKPDKPFIYVSNIPDLEVNKSWKERLLFLLPLIIYLILLVLILALSRPQKTLSEEKRTADGVDIMLALDLSSSMLAKDFSPNRLEAAKKVAKDFISNRSFDRIGLVAFAGESFTQCPLTTDYNVLKDLIDQLKYGMITDRTAIGMGISTAVNRLKDSDVKSKLIILMTDGENTAGYISPETARDIAKSYDIKVYTIGVGSKGVVLAPTTQNVYGQPIYSPTKTTIDEELLTNIANATGGKYYRATNLDALQKIYDEIDRLEKTEIEVTVYKKYTELFRWLISIAIGLILLYYILKHLVLKIRP